MDTTTTQTPNGRPERIRRIVNPDGTVTLTWLDNVARWQADMDRRARAELELRMASLASLDTAIASQRNRLEPKGRPEKGTR